MLCGKEIKRLRNIRHDNNIRADSEEWFMRY